MVALVNIIWKLIMTYAGTVWRDGGKWRKITNTPVRLGHPRYEAGIQPIKPCHSTDVTIFF
jgi:hypothetical protein